MRELDWLILRKLYEKRSISKAAEDLYVTQSALTKRVKTIEQEWGVEVVKRSSQGVTFTEDGRYLVKKAGIMLDFLGEIREHFSERHGVKELVRVGVPNSFARLHMPKLLKGYVDAYNRLQFKTEGNSEFQIPVTLDEDVAVSALTVAMSQPHLIDYTLHFDSVTLSEVTK